MMLRSRFFLPCLYSLLCLAAGLPAFGQEPGVPPLPGDAPVLKSDFGAKSIFQEIPGLFGGNENGDV